MTDEQFSELVSAGIDELPEKILKRLKNVAIVIADEPTKEQREDNDLSANETLFGLYEGIPQIDRGMEYHFVLPDKITIFKNPILDRYSDPADIRQCVSNTVWHEVAHHFGMDENEVAREEEKRGKTM